MYVFGYGSLTAAAGHVGATRRVVHALGFRRRWNVAMDNRRTLAGYKYYVDAGTGERPAVFVAFLNLVEHADSNVNGVILPVSDRDLDALDHRERNYDRLEISDRIAEALDGPVWAYLGSDAARRRYEQGAVAKAAIVDASYYEAVADGFRVLGDGALDEYSASTDEPACPIRRLRRIEL